MGTWRRGGSLWISLLAGSASACVGTAVEDDAASPVDAPPDAPDEGSWSRCCVGAHLAIPGGASRGSGDSLECYCPPSIACNYAWGACFRDAGASVDDAGFADADPMDASALDALAPADGS